MTNGNDKFNTDNLDTQIFKDMDKELIQSNYEESSNSNTNDSFDSYNEFNQNNDYNSSNEFNQNNDFNSNGENNSNSYSNPRDDEMNYDYRENPGYQNTGGSTPKGQGFVNVKVLGGIVVGFLALAIIFFIYNSRPLTIDLDKYAKVNFSGYDGAGVAEYELDVDGLSSDYGSRILKKAKSSKKLKSQLGVSRLDIDSNEITEVLVRSCIDGTLDKYDGLKTGDTVNLNWIVKDDIAKDLFKVNLKHSDIPFKVEGLEELGKLDPFADVELEFSGISPNIEVRVKNNSTNEYINRLRFGLDKDSNISNGEEIKVYVMDGDREASPDILPEYGILLESTSKTYKVDNQATYITSLKEVTEEARAAMEKQATDGFNAYISKSWDDNSKLTEFKYVGSYLLKNKFPERSNNINTYIMVFEFGCSVDSDGYRGSTKGYQTFSFKNLIKEDGKVEVDLQSMNTSYNSYSFEVKNDEGNTRNFSTYGFETLEDLYKNQVAANLENFEYEASDSLK